jgi:hypothetical protein
MPKRPDSNRTITAKAKTLTRKQQRAEKTATTGKRYN